METPHIAAVDVVEGGVVVTYDDASLAFYEESVLLAHLQAVPERDEAAPAERGKATRAMSVGVTKRGGKRESRVRAA